MLSTLNSQLSTLNSQRCVAVIGGGWAGMSAAVTLAERGLYVRVFEASRQLGGRARRVTLDGVDLDNGQHILIGAYRDTLAVMRKVGAEPDKLLLRRPLELRYADGFHLRAPRLPAPLHLVAALLGAKGLNLSEAWKAARFLAALRAGGFRVEPDRPVARWLAECGQDGKLRTHLWGPLCVSALNTPVDTASSRVFARVLRDGLTGTRAASDLLLARVDLARLFPEPAAEYVKARGGAIELGMPVRLIAGIDGGFRFDDRAERYSAVIVACAPQHAAPLLSGFPQLAATRAAIERLDYEPIVTGYLQYPDSVSLPAPMVGISGGMVQWVFDRGRLGGPKGLLAAVISGSGAHEDIPKEELVARIATELKASLGPLPPLRWSQLITEKRATFSCTPALPRPESVTAVPGLVLAGDYVSSAYPGTLEAAVRSGAAAAMTAIASGS